MKSFQTKRKKFIVIDNIGLKMTKKEFLKARGRYNVCSVSADKKFPHLRKKVKKFKMELDNPDEVEK